MGAMNVLYDSPHFYMAEFTGCQGIELWWGDDDILSHSSARLSGGPTRSPGAGRAGK